MFRHHGDDASSSPHKICRVCANDKQRAVLVHIGSTLSVTTGSMIEKARVASRYCFCFVLPPFAILIVFYHSNCESQQCDDNNSSICHDGLADYLNERIESRCIHPIVSETNQCSE